MRKAFGVYLVLIILVVLVCKGGSGRYDQNISVPKGDPQFPPLRRSWVIDNAGVLSSSVVTAADAICQKLKEDGIAEIAVVLIDSVKHPEDWSSHYGRWLGLGKRGLSTAGGNNGIVWLIRPDAKEKLTISAGRGLPRFTTVDYGAIIDKSIEYLNFNNFDKGAMELITQTDSVLRTIYGSKK
jgi:uncharacterized membrane protein YgcG